MNCSFIDSPVVNRTNLRVRRGAVLVVLLLVRFGGEPDPPLFRSRPSAPAAGVQTRPGRLPEFNSVDQGAARSLFPTYSERFSVVALAKPRKLCPS